MPWKALPTKKILVLILSLLLLPVGAWTFADEEIPSGTLTELKRAVNTQIEEIWKEKVDGKHVRRGTCAMAFQPAGEKRYEVEFYEDSIADDALTRERYTLTLEPDGSREWKVTDKKLLDNVTGLQRYSPGDETFFRFDAFSFDKEGLRAKGGPGTLMIRHRGEEITSATFVAEGLEYNYEPPEGVSFYARHQVIKHLKQKYLEFTPERGALVCSPNYCDEFLEEIFSNRREASRSDMDPLILEMMRDDEKELEKNRGKNNFGGFRFAEEQDNTFYMLRLKQKNKKHWLGLMYDDWDPKEVSLSVTGFWPVLYNYYSEATRKAQIDPYELEYRPDEEARFFDVRTIEGTVELAIEDSETMHGDLTYELVAHKELPWISFAITRNLRERNDKKATKTPNVKIETLRNEKGENLFWIQTGSNSGRVIFPEPIKKGQKFRLEMAWTNTGCIYDHSASYSYVDRGGWLPFVRFGDLIDSLKLTIKVPAKFSTLGIDKKVSEEVADGVNISRWESTHPISFPTIIYGEYYEVESETVAKKLDGTKIPVTIHVDKVAMHDSDIRPKQLRPLVEQAAQAINLYTQVWGVEYPFTKLDLVNDPVGGFLYGQAPASIIYLADRVFRGAGTMASVLDGADSTSISRFLKTVVAHETGHQWWGSSTANRNSGNYWFIESLAEYSSALYVEKAEGHDAYLRKVESWRQAVVTADLLYPIQSGYTEWAGEARGGAQSAIYNQGPFAFHILRETFGDAKFFTFLRMLGRSTANHEIVTRDIQKVAEAAFGGSMDWFFDQWIRGVGLPEYRWNITSRKTEDGQFLVEGTILQRVILGKKQEVLPETYFRGAIPVKISFADGSVQKVPLLVEGETTTVRFKVPKEPKKIGFNADNEILSPNATKGSGW